MNADISLVNLQEVPRGWRPAAAHIIPDYYNPLDAAQRMAQSMAAERGYESGARIGVHWSLVPDTVPYGEPKLRVELYPL